MIMMVSSSVRHVYRLRVISSTALGSEMSRKSFVCGLSLTKLPFSSLVYCSLTTSPSVRSKFCIIQYGM